MRFTLLAWLLSRALIAGLFVASSAHGISAIDNWDGAWYQSIAEHGYGFAHIGEQRDVAFFPLFPLSIRAFEVLGIPYTIAAFAFNNACFLGALLLLYRTVERRSTPYDARWCVTFACANPMSLFASVAYPESLFMLLTAAALTAHARGARTIAALAAAAAGAASAIGLALSAALVLHEAIRGRWREALVALVSFGGIMCFALFCWRALGDPLAFVHAQHAWRSGLGFNASAWLNLTKSLTSRDGFRLNIMTIVLVPVAAVAVFMQRKTLGSVMTLYALLAIALLLLSGEPISADRKASSVIPILIAIGRPLGRIPYAGAVAVLVLAGLLVADTWSFAHFQWVG